MEENKDKIKQKSKNSQMKPFAACNIAHSF